MALAAGTRVGPYEILAALGSGGMGEVYRARDTKLGRDVAVKVLPASVASDPERRARFEREAKAVAALSHPNILAIHDFGTHDGTAYAVMELLEGETLRDRLAEGALTPRQALTMASQVAAGLAAAHARGIVHRDLKPENLFLTRDGLVKILDFGLARSMDADPERSVTQAATGMALKTDEGTMLGTVGYMAPEQVRAQAVDHRADLFAFGAVLYEMLSGRRAFEGDTPADTISAILRSDPPSLEAIVAGLSPAIDRVVHRCLEKRPEERFQSARDVGFALEAVMGVTPSSGAAVTGVPPARGRRGNVRLTAAVIALLAAGFALGVWFRSASPPPLSGMPVGEFSFDAGFVFPPMLVLSPDGQTIAYTAPVVQSPALGTTWIRHLDDERAKPLSGTTVDAPLAWSPDGRRLLVYSSGDLVAADLASGQRERLGVVDALPRGALWLPDGILIGTSSGTIARLTPGTGTVEDVLELDATRDQELVRPTAWAGENRYLYLARRKDGELEARIARLDDRRTSDDPVVIRGAIGVQFVAPDALLYVKAGTLFAQRVDPETGRTIRDPVRLADAVYGNELTEMAAFGASPRGVLAYRTEFFPLQTFSWVDRVGRTLQVFPRQEAFSNFDLSPDDQRVATTVRARPYRPVWLLDFARGSATDVSERGMDHSDATWSPDGGRLAFRAGGRVVIRAANGGPVTEILGRTAYPETWSSDGRFLVVGIPIEDRYELWSLDLAQGNKTAPLVTGMDSLDEPRFSPDGRWVTFNAAEAGRRSEIYAVPFPPTGERYQLSVTSGTQARWRRDGQELYYLAPAGTLMAVRLPGGDPRRAAPPEALFEARLEVSSGFDQFAPSADGQRFLLRRPTNGTGDRAPVHVVINWRAQLDGTEVPGR